jgi:hypothetical protein
MQRRMFQPDQDTALAIRKLDEMHVQQFTALADEFIGVLDQLQSIRLPAYRLSLVDELQRICDEARQLRSTNEQRAAEHEDSLTFA